MQVKQTANDGWNSNFLH